MKKASALFLAAILALSLCACAVNGGDPADTQPDTSGATTDTTPDTVPSTTAPAVTEPPLKEFYLLAGISSNRMGESAYAQFDAQIVYDDDHNMTGINWTGLYDGVTENVEYTYMPNSLLIQQAIESSSDGGATHITDYTYDEMGNLLTLTIRRSSGLVVQMNENRYTYTPEGWIETGEAYLDGEIYHRYTYTYDTHGNLTSMVNSDGNGNTLIDAQYENSYNGDVLTKVVIYRYGVANKIIFYNPDGNRTLEINYSYLTGKEADRTAYTYENGNVILEQRSSNGKETYRKEYTYDETGNPLEIREFSGGELLSQETFLYEEGRRVGYVRYQNSCLDVEVVFTYTRVVLPEEQIQVLTELYSQLLMLESPH